MNEEKLLSQKDKNISVVGIGKLGICLALNLEKSGYNVLGCDVSEDYVKSINEKTFKSSEKGVNELLENSKNFLATCDLKKGIDFSDVIFLMVATPSLPDGKYDHSQIESVIEQMLSFGRQETKKTLVIGCTTYPGYCQTLYERIKAYNFEVVYNPEFIAQGNIIYGQIYPDMVLIGSSDAASSEMVNSIHTSMCKSSPKQTIMSLTEAELTKLAINCFITTKISFANMIGDLCNKLNISHENVLDGVGGDSRIGNKYLSWGYGFGGPCFPRDNRAIGILCQENEINPLIPKASDEYNNIHLKYHYDFLNKEAKGNKEITFEGVSYKKDSVLIDESQQLKMALMFADGGFNVTIKDVEEVIEKVKQIYQNKFNYEPKD